MVQKHNLFAFFTLISLLMVISSCKSSRSIVATPAVKVVAEENYAENILENAPVFDFYSSKMKLTVNLNGQDVSVNGNLRIKKDDVIQLSIVPLLGIEAARIEIGRDSILVLDRIHKEYVYVPISELKLLGNTDMDFYTLQSLFCNSLFLPGKKDVTKKELATFSVSTDAGQESMVLAKKEKSFLYSFTATPNNGQLTQSSIKTITSNYNLIWKYMDFGPFNGKSFPGRMNVTFEGSKKPVNVELEFSKMSTNNEWNTHSNVPSKYKEMDLNELIKRLLSL